MVALACLPYSADVFAGIVTMIFPLSITWTTDARSGSPFIEAVASVSSTWTLSFGRRSLNGLDPFGALTSHCCVSLSINLMEAPFRLLSFRSIPAWCWSAHRRRCMRSLYSCKLLHGLAIRSHNWSLSVSCWSRFLKFRNFLTGGGMIVQLGLTSGSHTANYWTTVVLFLLNCFEGCGFRRLL